MILLILIILFLSSCTNNLDTELYISSYHIAYDDGYVMTIISDDYVGEFKGDSLALIYDDISKSGDFEINYAYVKSVILDESVLKDSYIEEFIDTIKNTPYLDFNFYVFFSTEKAKDIYDDKNIINTKYKYSLYNDPTNINLYYSFGPLHFLDFSRDFLSDYDRLIIPGIDIISNWDDKTIKSNSIYYYDTNSILNNENDGLEFFTKNKYIIEGLDDYSFKITEYSMKINKKLRINIKGNFNMITGDIDMKKYVYDKLNYFIIDCYNKNIDILNIRGINYKYNKSYNYNDISIKIL